MSVVITGSGLVCALGVGSDAVWPKLLAGERAATRDIEGFDPKAALGGKGLRHWDRTALLLGCAARQALDQAGLSEDLAGYARDEMGVVCGSTHGSIQAIAEFDQEAVREGPKYVNPQAFANTTINQPAGRVSMLLDLPGMNTTLSTGSASALDALDYAATMVGGGRIGALVCGAALGLSPEIEEGYGRAGRISQNGAVSVPFARDRRGACLAEGGAAVVVERRARAESRGAAVLAELSGSGTAFDADSADASLRQAVELAAHQAGVEPGAIRGILAFAAGHPGEDAEELEALAACCPQARITALKAATGDCLEASGAIAASLGTRVLQEGSLPPIAGLDADRLDPAFAGAPLVLGRPVALDSDLLLVTARDRAGHASALILRGPS